MQNLVVTLIIIGALFYVGKRLVNSLRSGPSSCGCGCSGCATTGCSSIEPAKKSKDNKR
jgi:hypothetical protein